MLGLQLGKVALGEAFWVGEDVVAETCAEGGGAGPFAVLFQDLAEGDDLSGNKTAQEIDVVAALQNHALVAGEALAALERHAVSGRGAGGAAENEAVYLGRQVF